MSVAHLLFLYASDGPWSRAELVDASAESASEGKTFPVRFVNCIDLLKAFLFTAGLFVLCLRFLDTPQTATQGDTAVSEPGATHFSTLCSQIGYFMLYHLSM